MSGNTQHSQALTTHHDFDRGPKRAVLIMLALIAAMLIVVMLWMNFASLDISVHAAGKVIPSSRVQQIQSLEGGIIEALAVHEGQTVRKGDLLATVQNLQFDSELGEARQTYLAARAL